MNQIETTQHLREWVQANQTHPCWIDINLEYQIAYLAESKLHNHFSGSQLVRMFVEMPKVLQVEMIDMYCARTNTSNQQVFKEMMEVVRLPVGDKNFQEVVKAMERFVPDMKVIMCRISNGLFDKDGNCPVDQENLSRVKMAIVSANRILQLHNSQKP